MAEPSGQTTPAPSDIHAGLHAIAQVLRQAYPLSREAQQALAELLDELASALPSASEPSPHISHLADSAAHFVQAAQQRHDAGVLTAARQRLEQAIVGAESQTPFAAGLAQRLLDALANIGI